MAVPRIDRAGDSWVLAWDEHGVAMGLERLRENRDGLSAEVTVESIRADKRGLLLGPVNLNLLNGRGQVEFANTLDKRVNGLQWHPLVVQACAIVAKEYRAPTPTVRLADVPDQDGVEYVVGGLIPRGETTVLYGDGESAKSLLTLRIAVSIATGLELPWGSRPTSTGPVLVLDWETNVQTLRNRLRRVCQGAEIPVPTNVLYRGDTGDGRVLRSIDDEVANLRVQIQKEGIHTVLVDSIGFAVSGPLTEDATARGAMHALRQLAPATRLVVAHVSNTSANEPTRRVRPFGSAFFWNGMRSGIEVRRAEDQTDPERLDVALYHRKSNDGRHHRDMALSVFFEGENGRIAVDPADMSEIPDLAARTPLSARIRAMLERNKASTRELAAELEVPPQLVDTTLRRMAGVVSLTPAMPRDTREWGLLG